MNLVFLSVGFGLVTASILALAAVGFSMQFGITNILNLAYGATMTAAAFFAWYFNTRGVSVWLCLPIGAAFGALLSITLNRFLLMRFVARGAGLSGMIIVTLGIGVIIQNLILAIGGSGFYSYNVDPGPSVHVGPMIFTISQLGIMGVGIVAMLALHFLLTKTKLGRAMRATAADAALALASGIDTKRMIDVAWGISGALCGLAGVTLVANTTSFDSTTGSAFGVVIIAAVMLGGVGHAYGAMLGAVIIGLATEVSAVWIDPEYKNVVAFLVLVLVLLFVPRGIFGRGLVEAQQAA